VPIEPLLPEQLYRCCTDELPQFATTAELEDLIDVPGQERAMRAMRFGIGIKRPGYNIFALGGPGTAKHAMVHEFLDRVALGEPVPSDLCYVFNFEEPHEPVAIFLPPGMAAGFRADMAQLVKDLRATMPALFESANYRARRDVIDDEFKQRQESAFEHLQELGKARNVMLIRTPNGFGFAPAANGGVLSPEEFQKLPEESQEKIRNVIEGLQEELERTLGQVPAWEKERREQLVSLNRKMTTFAVGNRIDDIQARYKDYPAILAYLDAVERDIVDHVEIFLGIVRNEAGQAVPAPPGTDGRLADGNRFRRYQVNVIVDNTGKSGAPVVYEDNPTFANLVGVIEQMADMGALISDFSLIKGGALHRANGGYLVVDARKLLIQPHAWEALKRAIRSREIRIESPGQMYTLVTTVTLEPKAVPLNIRVVLVGDRQLYYQLAEFDPDFAELFKVAADFEDDMPRQPDTMVAFARLIATITRRESTRPFERDAVERIVEHASRLADDARKLSMRISAIADVMREADYIAEQGKLENVGLQQVEEALAAQRDRSERVRDRSQEMIQRGLVLIDTDGARIGQVNGLSVMTLGTMSFGKPTRISARVRLGRGEVIDIERQVDLGGPIHSKGVLILAGYLGSRYAENHPMSLSATLVFEQSYGGVDGDSASSTELYALLSALSDLPIKQGFAVTGSVNQYGEIQVIGGVNEKIEGFFDVCRKRGLTGEQGVLIPAGNVQHLMLRRDVVDAVRTGKFHIYPVRRIDEGIELLTGVAAGERQADRRFPEGSVNRRVEDRLISLAEQRRRYGLNSEASS
jgi:lon-related putative ATP-dependent protease